MTNTQLQAYRKLLFLDVAEAAKHLAEASARAWQYWEKGERDVPDDVAESISGYVGMWQMKLDSHMEEGTKPGYYRTLEEFKVATGKSNVVMWRMTQSLNAFLSASGK